MNPLYGVSEIMGTEYRRRLMRVEEARAEK